MRHLLSLDYKALTLYTNLKGRCSGNLIKIAQRTLTHHVSYWPHRTSRHSHKMVSLVLKTEVELHRPCALLTPLGPEQPLDR